MTTPNDLVPTNAEIKEIGDGSVEQLARALTACAQQDQDVYRGVADEIANIYGVKGMYVLVKCVIARIVALGPQGPDVLGIYTIQNADGSPISTDPEYLAENPHLRAMVASMRLVTSQATGDEDTFNGLWCVLAENSEALAEILVGVGSLLAFTETMPQLQRCEIGPAVFDPDGCTVYATDNAADGNTFDMAEQLVVHHKGGKVVMGLARVEDVNVCIHTAFDATDARHIAAMLILKGGYTVSGAPIQGHDSALDIAYDDEGNVLLVPVGKPTAFRRVTLNPEEARRMAVRLLAAADRAPEGTA